MKENQTMLASRKTKMKRWLTRRWLYPAMYVGVASMFIAVMWIMNHKTSSDQIQSPTTEVKDAWNYSPSSEQIQSSLTIKDDANAVQATHEAMQWPVAEAIGIVQTLHFYNERASEPAIVSYENTYRPHLGVDFSNPTKQDQTFDVQAALSGTVETVKEDPLTGKTVVLKHENGYETIYYSLENLTVKENDTVKQGQAIGSAGRNELEKAGGIHVHFEVQKDGKPIDPSKEIKE